MEQIKDQGEKFDVSWGNLLVLSKIPALMANEEYRIKLRALVMDYMSDEAKKAWKQ
jgi:hypothetical protein